MTEALTSLLETCNTPALFDVLRIHSLPVIELPRGIRGLEPSTRLAGPVFTVVGRPDAGISVQESLQRFIRDFLSAATPGHVAVIQPADHRRSCMGGLAAAALKLRAVRGVLIDGGVRDADEIIEIGFPVFCAYTSPIDIVGSWRLEATQVPIRLGGIDVMPGDYILDDRDGGLLIPGAHADFVITETARTMDTDSAMRTAIRSGRDPYDAFLEFGKL